MKNKYIYKLVNAILTKVIILFIVLVVVNSITLILFENNSVEMKEYQVSKVEDKYLQAIEKIDNQIFVLIVLIVVIFIFFILYFLEYKKNKRSKNNIQRKETEDLRKIDLKIDGLKKDVDYLKTMMRTNKYENNDKDNKGINVSVNVNGKDY